MLPIHLALSDLKSALRAHRNVVLQAPPGAGKSTVVPLELLQEPWLGGRRILMLEPRRLAARAVAARMADTLREPVGRTVGYRMRLDTRVSAATRIEVITEGILTAMMQDDPALEDVGCVIFDEFHERSLQADLGLALCLDVQATLNEELRLLAMSATLAAEPLARLLGDAPASASATVPGNAPENTLGNMPRNAPIVRAEGRSFPVDIRYVDKNSAAAQNARSATIDSYANTRDVAATVRRALEQEGGDVLVFLPGTAEIRRVQSALLDAGLEPNVRIAPLFGDLSREEQDRALEPSPPGKRKVVLATNIAETSLTIEGVRVVVDSGLTRRSRFDPVSGMSRLETLRASKASAEQRCGRAGRLEAGVCYRLWTEGLQQTLEAHTPAEILEADLAPLALELAGWNVRDPAQLKWLDSPPVAAFAQACDLLRRLGALDKEGRVTAHGRHMLELRAHPRIAHLLVRARELGMEAVACDVAALLGERDIVRGRAQERDADVRVRLEALQGRGSPGVDVDRGAVERVRKMSAQYQRQLKSLGPHLTLPSAIAPGIALPPASMQSSPPRGAERGRHEALMTADSTGEVGQLRAKVTMSPAELRPFFAEVGLLLALAYPDRIARWRTPESGRYRLSNGRGAFFAEPQSLARSEFLAVVELDGGEREARIFLAAPVERDGLERVFAAEISAVESVRWDSQQHIVVASRAKKLGELILEESTMTKPDVSAVRRALLEGIRELSLSALPWDTAAREFQARVEFARKLEGAKTNPDSASVNANANFHANAQDNAWPDVSDDALLVTLEQWLEPWLDGMTRRDHLARLNIQEALEALLDWNQKQRLEAFAPSHVTVPSGSRIPISYLDGDTPSFSVRLQEMFGMQESPRIAGGKVALLVKLLSPAHRPVQVTRDLASFWRSGYAEVRKELKGRYPRHYWPENPFEAEAIRGSKKKK